MRPSCPSPQGLRAATSRSRFECKYIVNPLLVAPMRQFLLSLARTDPFALSWPDHRYPVCSLYLDTDDLRFYRQYLRGEKSRVKLRARTYSDDPAAPVFLEVKSRHDRVVTKRRVALTREEAAAALGGHPNGSLARFRGGAADFDAFSVNVALATAKPVVRVKYLREPYVGFDPEPVRVTFDTRLECQPTFGPVLTHGGGHWVPVPLSGVLVEVKFTDCLPSWLAQMVRAFGLVQVPCCKYARSVGRLISHGGAAALSVAGFTLPPVEWQAAS